ncbi:hypothetical protein [Saezia sanguinis]|uniref:hypothetical protein n=1 Tax=Saezia sanguinis TaxID=1965230 RepID=UPI00305B31E4
MNITDMAFANATNTIPVLQLALFCLPDMHAMIPPTNIPQYLTHAGYKPTNVSTDVSDSHF